MLQAFKILETTTNTTGTAVLDKQSGGAFQATILGTGVVACTVTIECSLDSTNWMVLGTITLSGTTSATDGFSSLGQWVSYRAVTTGVSGTVSSIVVSMSTEE